MANKETLAKARMELEELYLGIPDESVNLTFEDLAELKPIKTDNKSAKETATSKDPISEPKFTSSLAKLPSLDFNRGLQGVSHSQPRPYKDSDFSEATLSHAARSHGFGYIDDESHYGHMNPKVDLGLVHPMAGREAYVDISGISMTGISMTSMQQERCVRRRPGIPHSNICTICSTYIYIFRHRCLVCGRVYCRQCLNRGMGDMTEGRKCIECLGRRFSHRYIMRAGQVGWWWWRWCGCGYSSTVREAEIEWAEKGPRRRGEKGNGRGSTIMLSTMSSHVTPRTPTRSRSPMAPRTPTQSTTTPPHSFVSSSSYSPYSPAHRHQLPF